MGKRVSAPQCHEAQEAPLANLACAKSIFPNAMLPLGFDCKICKTLFPDVGKHWAICNVGRQLCRRIFYDVMFPLLSICQDLDLLSYSHIPRLFKHSLSCQSFCGLHFVLHFFVRLLYLEFHFIVSFCCPDPTMPPRPSGTTRSLLFWPSVQAFSQWAQFFYLNFCPLSVLYLYLTHFLS